MFNIICWLWDQPGGRSKFSVDHVCILEAMINRYVHIPHRFSCVTDFELPSHIHKIIPPKEFEDLRIPTWGEHRPQCLRRISMFRPDAAELFGEKFVCMDLDVVISDNITDMFTDDEFRICKGTSRERPYNGSMMLIEAGKRSKVYNEFSLETAIKAGERYIGSDQAFISYILGPNEKTWTEEDGLSWYRGNGKFNESRIVFFNGNEKPWHLTALGESSFLEQHYRGERGGRCLILGYGKSLWQDVEQAILKPFDAVVASPEAAEYWPGPILSVVNSNEEANRVAIMHGFKEIVYCGLE